MRRGRTLGRRTATGAIALVAVVTLAGCVTGSTAGALVATVTLAFTLALSTVGCSDDTEAGAPDTTGDATVSDATSDGGGSDGVDSPDGGDDTAAPGDDADATAPGDADGAAPDDADGTAPGDADAGGTGDGDAADGLSDAPSPDVTGPDAGSWEPCCDDGQIDTCYCPPNTACNYGAFQDCGDGTCVSTLGGTNQGCPDGDAGGGDTDVAEPDSPDADAVADAADAGDGDAGTWEPCCVDGQIDTCYCPPNAVCNYGLFEDCGDGTCVSQFPPSDESCPDADADADAGDGETDVGPRRVPPDAG